MTDDGRLAADDELSDADDKIGLARDGAGVTNADFNAVDEALARAASTASFDSAGERSTEESCEQMSGDEAGRWQTAGAGSPMAAEATSAMCGGGATVTRPVVARRSNSGDETGDASNSRRATTRVRFSRTVSEREAEE